MKFFVILAVVAASVSANPAFLFPRQGLNQCNADPSIASIITTLDGPSASAFCSSYIATTVTTTSATATSTTIITATSGATSVAALVTSASLSATPSPTASAYPTCGARGYDSNNATVAYFYDPSGALNTYAACSGRCLNDTRCEVFAVGTKACLMYDRPIDGNVKPVADSQYLFYARSCIAPAKRAVEIRDITTPAPLTSLSAPSISAICSCIISAPATTTLIVPTVTVTPVTIQHTGAANALASFPSSTTFVVAGLIGTIVTTDILSILSLGFLLQRR